VTVTGVRFVRGSPEDLQQGLLGYVSFEVAPGVVVDGVTVRRNLQGGVGLSYPGRRDRGGRLHPYLRPIDPSVRKAIEDDVLGQVRPILEGQA